MGVAWWSLGVTGGWGFQHSSLEGEELRKWLVVGPASLALGIFFAAVQPVRRWRGRAAARETARGRPLTRRVEDHSTLELAGRLVGRSVRDPLLRIRRS